jgi:hypothetical protein
VKMDKNEQTIPVKTIPFSSRFMVLGQLPEESVAAILKEVRIIIDDPNSTHEAPYLAGQIIKGSEIRIREDQCGPNLNKFKVIIKNFCEHYVNEFFKKVSEGDPTKSKKFQGEIDIERLWIVRQLEGDYNPLHDHTTRSPTGLSGVFYLQRPAATIQTAEGILAKAAAGTAINSKEKSSFFQGMLQVPFGERVNADYVNFITSEAMTIAPHPGKLILFPSNQSHLVYAFSEPGERICLAFNANVWYSSGVTPWANLLNDMNTAIQTLETRLEKKTEDND